MARFLRNLGAVCLATALSIAGYISEYNPLRSAYGQERGSVARRGPNYAIVVSDSTYNNKKWRLSVDALMRKYPGAHVVRFRRDIEEAGDELREIQPTHVAYLAAPEELAIPDIPASENGQRRAAERSNIGRFSRLICELDDDPYKDAIDQVITGFVPEDAERLAGAQPFVVDNPLFKTQDEYMRDPIGEFPTGRSYTAGICPVFDGRFVRRRVKDSSGIHEKILDLAGPEILEALNSGEVDLFATIGVADPSRWKVGFNYHDYVFEADGRGGIIVKDAQGNTIGSVNSPNQKVYWGVGHNEFARIGSRTPLILAWIHSGGADQVFGYLGGAQYGFASASIPNHLFASDTPTFPEARHMNDIAMRYLADKLEDYRRSNGLVRDLRDQVGREFDEHTFVGFGDPALDVRVMRDAATAPFLDKQMEVSRVDGRKEYRFSVRSNRNGTLDSASQNAPTVISVPVFLLPESVGSPQDVRATEGLRYHIGDDFVVFDIGNTVVAEKEVRNLREIMVPKLAPTQLREGQTWELSFTD